MGKHESIPYNPEIAKCFFLAGLIEAWGRGIERIIEACKQDDYPTPEWKVEPNGVWVVFDFEPAGDSENMGNAERLRSIVNDYERLTPNEKLIIDHLLSKQTITRNKP
ncbi:MAG: hypothetical protein GXZ05_05995 [Gammaproteobacteria bacterium]|nr:hypothetical protein [Gammaproteobacteria bacterium]